MRIGYHPGDDQVTVPVFALMLSLADYPAAAALPPPPVPVEEATPVQIAPAQPVVAAPPLAVPVTPGAEPVAEAARQDVPTPATTLADTPAQAPDARADELQAAATGSDIVVTARSRWEAPDPLGNINAESFKLTDSVDRSLIGPVSMAYKRNVPGPVRDGIHNFLYNLREPIVFINFLLQHKIGKAAETIGRFAINTTVGAVGVFDIAKRKPFKLPRRSNGFANTLGFYGVPNGLFLYLPLVGPTTVRDLFGGAVDRILLPISLGQGVTDPKFAIPAGTLSALDHRAEFDETYTAIKSAPGDPYANSRDFYLQRRQAEIDRLHGRAGGDVGGMFAAPKGTIRLKGRGGQPTMEVPVAPRDAAPAAPASTPAPAAAPVPVPVPASTPAPMAVPAS